MTASRLTTAQAADGVRSLYRDPVGPEQASARWCVVLAGLHYPPLASWLRALHLAGQPAPERPTEEDAVAWARDAGLQLTDCSSEDGRPCGGLAGIEPSAAERQGFGRPYDS